MCCLRVRRCAAGGGMPRVEAHRCRCPRTTLPTLVAGPRLPAGPACQLCPARCLGGAGRCRCKRPGRSLARRARARARRQLCAPRPAPDRVAAGCLLEAERHVRADVNIVPGYDCVICGGRDRVAGGSRDCWAVENADQPAPALTLAVVDVLVGAYAVRQQCLVSVLRQHDQPQAGAGGVGRLQQGETVCRVSAAPTGAPSGPKASISSLHCIQPGYAPAAGPTQIGPTSSGPTDASPVPLSSQPPVSLSR